MLTTRLRGTSDILPGETEQWRILEKIIHEICSQYGYREIRTPIFEHTELFLRGVGETTDIVEKEMYTFLDRGERSITLRPEGTAPTVRAFLENRLYAQAQPTKLYYLGPMFRYGRPQAGRLRQFHQFGVEVFGSVDPAVDAEVIILAMDFYQRLGLQNLQLVLNSVGCPQCRPVHKKLLQEYFRPRLEKFCPTCQGRFDRNPLRILDCKSDICQELSREAPTITDTLCRSCQSHFEQVQGYLDMGEISYQVDPFLVRGLDYYTNTAFEVIAPGIGAQNAIGGGGRYDGLVEEIGGQPVPGIGFGLGLERILLLLKNLDLLPSSVKTNGIFLATTGRDVRRLAFQLLHQLRKEGLPAEMDYLDRSLKSQLKFADKSGFRFVIFLGEDEWKQQEINFKDLTTGEQARFPLEEVVSNILRYTGEVLKNNG